MKKIEITFEGQSYKVFLTTEQEAALRWDVERMRNDQELGDTSEWNIMTSLGVSLTEGLEILEKQYNASQARQKRQVKKAYKGGRSI